MSISLAAFDPIDAERGRNEQAQKLYLQRVCAFQTNLPPSIAVDWFQEQPGTALRWQFLDLQNISWAIETFELSAIPGGEAFRGGAAHLARLSSNVHWERQWVYKTIEREGTWTTPPILLRTESMEYLSPPANGMQTPLHLAEGFHRVAALHALRQKGAKLAERHDFRVGSPKMPATGA